MPQPPTAPVKSPLASPEPWDLVSDAYTRELVPEFEQYARDAIRLAALPPTARVVDVATGPGTVALLLAAGGARVDALDFSPAMIANLRRRAAEAKITTIEAHQGDGQRLPFDNDAYDGAFSMFGLMFFPDRGQGFRELHRVLRPDGRAVVSSWAPFEGPFALVLDSLRELLPGLPFGQGRAPLGDPAEFAQEMSVADFREVVVHQVTHDMGAPSVDEFWAGVQRTTAPVALLARNLGPEKWPAVAAGVLDRLRTSLGDGPVVAKGTANLGVGIK
jgi:SAM-dependent methyltransferase